MHIAETLGDIHEFYKFNDHRPNLGKGSFGAAFTAVHCATGLVCAVKQIPKLRPEEMHRGRTLLEQIREAKRRDVQQVKTEIEIMRSLEDEHIVRLMDSFEDPGKVYLVMELCAGGGLMHFILSSRSLTEALAAFVMKQIFQAVSFMHDRYICHRDLKPTNVLLLTDAPLEENTIKVTDFGYACKAEPGTELNDLVGTLQYIAPQVLSARYDLTADIWSCGVVTFELLCGVTPFGGETEASVLASVRRGNYAFGEKDWCRVSDEAKNLVRALLKMEPRERHTARQAINHTWLCGDAPTAPLWWPSCSNAGVQRTGPRGAGAETMKASKWRDRLTQDLNKFDVWIGVGCRPCKTPLGCLQACAQ